MFFVLSPINPATPCYRVPVLHYVAAHAQPQADSHRHQNEYPLTGKQHRQLPSGSSPTLAGSRHLVAAASAAPRLDVVWRCGRDGLSDAQLGVAGNTRPAGLPTDKLTCHRRDALWPTAAAAAAAAAAPSASAVVDSSSAGNAMVLR